MRAKLCLNTYAGRIEHIVQITGETRTRYQFRTDQDLRLPNRRLIKCGETGSAPKHAFKLEE